MYFTTSWDDNCTENEKIGNLLLKYNIKGTFYIDNPRKNPSLARNLSAHFTIGAHTINHPYLSQLSIIQQEKEIAESKNILEEIINKPVELFAYPYGDYDQKTIQILKKTGFKFARTTSANEYHFNKKSVYEIPVSLIILPTKFERERKISDFIRVYRNRKHLRKIFHLSIPVVVSCIKTIEHIILYNSDKVDFLHLWGHSWQIDKFSYWSKLETIFSIIASKPLIQIVNNRELFEAFSL